MSELENRIRSIADPSLSASQIAEMVGCTRTTVYRCMVRYGIILKQRKKPNKKSHLTEDILSFSGKGIKSADIAKTLGCSAKHVQNMLRIHNADRLGRGALNGCANPSYKHGRKIDRDGYVLVSAPLNHPYARKRNDRNHGLIYEHRLVMEDKLRRYLSQKEIVDHIDGLRLHNDPSNLRLFDSNADHLKATISGQVPQWSQKGSERMKLPHSIRSDYPRVDNYRAMKVSGDARLIQILLALLILGKDSPYLLGTSLHLEKAGISDLSRSSLEHELDKLYQKYA